MLKEFKLIFFTLSLCLNFCLICALSQPPIEREPSYNCAKDIKICDLYTQIDKLEQDYNERFKYCEKKKIAFNCYEYAKK